MKQNYVVNKTTALISFLSNDFTPGTIWISRILIVLAIPRPNALQETQGRIALPISYLLLTGRQVL